MQIERQLLIGGQWVEPSTDASIDVIDPRRKVARRSFDAGREFGPEGFAELPEFKTINDPAMP